MVNLCLKKTKNSSLCKNYNEIGLNSCYIHRLLEEDKKCIMYSKKGIQCKSYKMKDELFCRIHKKYKNLLNKDNKCSICLNFCKKGSQIYLNCKNKHMFHRKCIYKWLKNNNTCPLCREEIKKKFEEKLKELIESFLHFGVNEGFISNNDTILKVIIHKHIYIKNKFKIFIYLEDKSFIIYLET